MEERIKSEVYNRLMLACQQVMYQGYTLVNTAFALETAKQDKYADDHYLVLQDALNDVTEALEKINNYKNFSDSISGVDIAIGKVATDLVYGWKTFDDLESATVIYEGEEE